MIKFHFTKSLEKMSEEESENGGNEIRVTNNFAALCDDYSEEEEEAFIPPPVVIPKVAPPPPKKQQKKKEEINEEDEFLALMEEQKKKANTKVDRTNKITHSQKLLINMARELNEKYSETAFDDANKIPKNSPQNKFISKRRNWPNTIPVTFRSVEISPNIFRIELADYGKEQQEKFEKAQVVPDALEHMVRANPFCIPILTGIATLGMFYQKFSEATDYVLRLTWIIQQAIPQKFQYGITKFDDSGDIEYYLNVVAFVARFSYRRGCYDTSNALWKFGLDSCVGDPGKFLFFSAFPAFQAEDKEFPRIILESDRKHGNLPAHAIPDWQIVVAIQSLPDTKPLEKACQIWSFIFGDEEMEEEIPDQLQSISLVLKRKLQPIIEADPALQTAIHQGLLVQPTIEIEEEKQAIFDLWNDFKEQLDFQVFVEEDVLPVLTT